MKETFKLLSEKRSANLRVRMAGIALVIVALLTTRQLLYFQIEFMLYPAVLFFLELVVVWFLLHRLDGYGKEPRALRVLLVVGQLQVVAELLLLTWVVYYTGGITSPLIPLYLIYILGDGLTSRAPTLILHAILAMLLLVLVTGETFYGLIPRYNIGIFPENTMWNNAAFVDGALIVFAAMMTVTLIVAITFSRRTADREQELGESAGQLSVRVEQVNTLRDIGQRLASSLELDQVMDAVGESALRVVKATDVHLYTYDEDLDQFGTGIGVWADGHRGTVLAIPRGEGISSMVARTKRPLIVNNAESHPLFQSLQARAWAIKAIASFPIIKADRLIAVMNVAFLDPHEFTRQEEEALGVLCDQAAIAIDNARLYQQVQRKIQELSALNAVTQSAAQLTDISSMLNDALGGVLSAVNADGAIVATVDEHKNTLELAAHRGLTSTAINEFKTRPLKVGEALPVKWRCRASRALCQT